MVARRGLGFGLIALDLAGQADRGVADARVLYFLATMTVAVLVGLWAWAWRSPPRMGKLMYLWPVLVVTADLPNAYPDSSVASTIGLATFVFGLIVFAQMALSYPTGYLMPGRLAFFYIFIGGYLAEVIQNVVNMLFWDNRACRPFCATPYAPTLIHIGSAPFSLETWNKGWTIFVMAILPIGLYLLGRRYYQASVGVRRSIGPVLATGIFITVMGWIYDYAFLTDRFSALTPLSWWLTSGLLVGALTALFGLLVGRRVRGSVGDLVVELDRAGPGGVRRALARAVGDPTLELALWLPEAGTWADESGRPVVLPEGRDRAVTLIGDRLAAIVHDPVLLDQTAMLEAVGTAARVALENERLQAELRAQLVALRESRARIVRAGDEERRRLERDLHDGAQQRLLGVGMGLQMLKARVGGDADASALLDDTEAEVQMALQELRELARGIHPAVLTDQGLAAAVRTLAERAPLPVEVSDGGEPLPPHVETAAYFVVAEAIANIVKYAQASRAWVTIDCRGGAGRRRGARRRHWRGEGGWRRLGAARPCGPRRGARRAAHRREPAREWHASASGDPVRVVIADDAALIRTGLARLLADAGVEVCGEASDAGGLMALVEEHRPDVAVVDIRMPPGHSDEGLVAAATIRERFPGVGVLVLSQYVESAYALRLIDGVEGSCGYLLKDRLMETDELVSALERVAAGEVVVDRHLVEQMLSRRRVANPIDELTSREREVLALMAEGLTDKGIASRLWLTPKTVETHIRHILRKLDLPAGASNNRRVHAVLVHLKI